ncbi:MAG: M28 family peptidase [Acidobacteriota bacterium]|nr:M28 family peptidase [Acidobacteriota bacterium]
MNSGLIHLARKTLALLLPMAALTAACAQPISDATDSTDSGTERHAATHELGPAAVEAASLITAEVLRAPITELASDEYAGRGPGSDGDRMTQEYLIEQLETIGFEPGASEGGWLQPFDIVGIDAKAPGTWRFSAGDKAIELTWWDDYIASSGVQEESARIDNAELVFVGYGIQAPEYDWDDFKGVDVSGKILLIMNNDPDWDPELFEGNRRLYYGRWTYKYEKAAELGAAGAIIIHTTPSAGYPFQVVQTSWTGPQFEIPAAGEPRVQVPAWTSEDAAYRLMELGGHDLDALRESAKSRDFEPMPLGITASVELTNQVERVETANVIGVLPGSDPELGSEYIVYSAHHDHLGVGKPNDDGDEIYNGARDNAAGVSQVLAIARAFASLPERPRRSIMVAFVAAEEQGLLGSAYLSRNPPVPAGRLTANLNYDGGNIWGRTRDITFIGYGKSSLDAVVEKFAAEQDRVVKPDQFPDKGYFYRSDQFNFAKVGVPAIYLDEGTDFVGRPEGWGREQIETWTGVDYHQPSDQLTDDWNFEGMIEDAVLGLRCGYFLAEQDAPPTWTPGDEFEAARLEALEQRASY